MINIHIITYSCALYQFSWIPIISTTYPDLSCKYTPAVRAVVGRVSDGVRTTVRTDRHPFHLWIPVHTSLNLPSISLL